MNVRLAVVRLLGVEVPEPKKDPPPEKPDRLAQLQDAMNEMRAHLRRTGAGFGAGATAVLAGLGYTQLHELFPVPPTHRAWIAGAALAGITLAAVGAVVLSGRFFSAQRRVRVTPRLGGTDIRGEDADIQRALYTAVAQEENAASLEAVEQRARRYERIARVTSDEKTKAALEKEAKRLTESYRWAMYFSAASILERRSRDAFRGSRVWALTAAAGIVLAFGAADYAKGERDKVEVLEACVPLLADAPEACDSVRSSAESDRLQDEAEANAAEASAALEDARGTFANQSGSSLVRMEACSKVLLSTPGFKGAGDEAKAAVANACLQLVRG